MVVLRFSYNRAYLAKPKLRIQAFVRSIMTDPMPNQTGDANNPQNADPNAAQSTPDNQPVIVDAVVEETEQVSSTVPPVDYTQNTVPPQQPAAPNYNQQQPNYAQPNYAAPQTPANPYAQPAQPAQPQYAQPTNPYDANQYAAPNATPNYATNQAPTYTSSTGQQYAGASSTQSPFVQNQQDPLGQQAPFNQQAQPPFGQQPQQSPFVQNQPFQQPYQQQYQQAPYGQQPQQMYANGAEPPLNQPWYGIGFGDAIARFFKKYATFSGRASRGEYWWVFLFTTIVSVVLSMFGQVDSLSTLMEVLTSLWNLAIIVPTIALAVRRLHDSNLNGAWFLLPYGLEFLGLIIMLAGGVGSALSGNMNTFLVGGGASIVIGLLFVIGGAIAQIVLMVRPSDPRGAIYDSAQ